MNLLTRRITRRQAIGTAAGTAVGAAGIGFGLGHLQRPPATTVPTAASGWATPLGSARGLDAHLLRRAGFAFTEAELDNAAAMKYSDLVERVVSEKPQPLPTPADVTNYQQVTQAWYTHMATTSAQFPERMTLFWHGVLTSDFRQAARLPFVHQQNVLYRTAGLTDLRSLLVSVTHDPLMMRYLNLDASTAAAPNENYARELMELFTLGPGNYSETDVRESARALSGLRIVFYDASGRSATPPKYSPADPQGYADQLNALVSAGATFRGTLAPRLHDSGSKTFLGRTGNFGPDDVIDILLAQPACAPFVTRRTMSFFATPTASDSDVNAVAKQFRDSRYDLRTLMRAIFTSSAFTSQSNYRSLVRSPADFIVATMRVLNRNDILRLAMAAAPGMDQVLYDPPNVAGWPTSSGWISSSALLTRINFATAASTTAPAAGALPDPAAALSTHLDNVLSPSTSAAYRAATTDSDRWFAVLASPEFQLK